MAQTENARLRAEWQRECRAKRHLEAVPFPRYTCNGKKNRHRWPGKGGMTVIK